jgi:hypothetical protein
MENRVVRALAVSNWGENGFQRLLLSVSTDDLRDVVAAEDLRSLNRVSKATPGLQVKVVRSFYHRLVGSKDKRQSLYHIELWSEKTLPDYIRGDDGLAAWHGCNVVVIVVFVIGHGELGSLSSGPPSGAD